MNKVNDILIVLMINNTPTNHSHAKPLSIPNLVNYFSWNVLYVKYKKCYFVAYRLLLPHG